MNRKAEYAYITDEMTFYGLEGTLGAHYAFHHYKDWRLADHTVVFKAVPMDAFLALEPGSPARRWQIEMHINKGAGTDDESIDGQFVFLKDLVEDDARQMLFLFSEEAMRLTMHCADDPESVSGLPVISKVNLRTQGMKTLTLKEAGLSEVVPYAFTTRQVLNADVQDAICTLYKRKDGIFGEGEDDIEESVVPSQEEEPPSYTPIEEIDRDMLALKFDPAYADTIMSNLMDWCKTPVQFIARRCLIEGGELLYLHKKRGQPMMAHFAADNPSAYTIYAVEGRGMVTIARLPSLAEAAAAMLTLEENVLGPYLGDYPKKDLVEPYYFHHASRYLP